LEQVNKLNVQTPGDGSLITIRMHLVWRNSTGERRSAGWMRKSTRNQRWTEEVRRTTQKSAV